MVSKMPYGHLAQDGPWAPGLAGQKIDKRLIQIKLNTTRGQETSADDELHQPGAGLQLLAVVVGALSYVD